ncbi:MAG: hypothetical protein AAFY26_21830, partial [Cyanobacteria bacterium J06638_22]
QSVVGVWGLVRTIGDANGCGSETRVEFRDNGVFSTPNGVSTNYAVRDGIIAMEYNRYLDGPMDIEYEINSGRLYLSPINPSAERPLNCTYIYERLD